MRKFLKVKVNASFIVYNTLSEVDQIFRDILSSISNKNLAFACVFLSKNLRPLNKTFETQQPHR